jgi:hypothetical protein
MLRFYGFQHLQLNIQTNHLIFDYICVDNTTLHKMALPKGRTNNPNGRPTGTVNKNSKEIREIISSILSQNIDRIQEDIDSLEPKDRLTFMEKLFQYAIPKLQSTSIHTIEPAQLDIRTRPAWLDAAL